MVQGSDGLGSEEKSGNSVPGATDTVCVGGGRGRVVAYMYTKNVKTVCLVWLHKNVNCIH